MGHQYEDVNRQMKNQIQQLVGQVQTLEQEKIDLAQSKNELTDKIFEIETKNNSANVVQVNEKNESSVIGETDKVDKIMKLEEELADLKNDKNENNTKLESLISSNLQLARLNEELEKELNALKSDEDERISMQEHQHVIEQLHSEKQQLSRVIVQNKQMKEKFEDLNLQVENLNKENTKLSSELSAQKLAETDMLEKIKNFEELKQPEEKAALERH